ncbi:MAG: O-antigen ligase family protein [Thermoleophilia bacterium]
MQTNGINISLQTNAPGNTSLLDRAAAALLFTVIFVSVLYPETFIIDLPIFGSQRTLPLSILLPVVVAFTVLFAIKRRETVIIGYLDIAVLTFSTYLLLRNVFSPESLLAVKYGLLGTGLFFLTAILSQRIDLARWITWLFVSLASVTCSYGLMEFILQNNYIYGDILTTTVGQPLGELHRVGSSLVHPVSYGAFLIQLLPFCLLAWYTGRNILQRVFAMATTAVATLALFLTFSKGSWIVLGIIIVWVMVFFAVFLRSSRAIYIVAVFLAILAVLTGVFWQKLSDDLSDRSEMSVSIRLKGWNAAIGGIGEHPLTGVGLKKGDDVVWSHLSDVTRASLEEGNLRLPVDNYYLNIFLEEGLIGLILWLGMLLLLVVEGVRFIMRETPSRPWALAALVGIVGISINTVTFDALLIWPNYIVFWVTAGLLHGLSQKEYMGAGSIKPL